MSIKQCIVLFFFLLFVTKGCASNSGGQSSTPDSTPSPASTPSTSAADNKPKPESSNTSSQGTGAKPAIDACALLEKSEIAAVQGQQVNEAKSSSRDDDQFAISQCFYMAAVFDRSVSLEVTQRNPKNPEQDVLKNFWKERFQQAKASRKKEKPKLVEGIGDEAYWVGNDQFGALYALKKDKMVRISVGGPGNANEKIEKSKTLVAKALMRLD